MAHEVAGPPNRNPLPGLGLEAWQSLEADGEVVPDGTLTFIISPGKTYIWKGFQKSNVRIRCLYPSGWYLKKLHNNIQYLGDMIASLDYERIFLFGTSGGAYASILYGSLLASFIDLPFTSLACAPQTLIYPQSPIMDPKHFKKYAKFEETMKDEMNNIVYEYCDLNKVLNKNHNDNHKVLVMYGDASECDVMHFNHIKNAHNVKGIPTPGYKEHSIWYEYYPHGLYKFYD